MGVPRDAEASEIRRAFVALARRNHPDLQGPGAPDGAMPQINAAWHVLSDESRRRDYDRTLLADPDPAPSGPVTMSVEDVAGPGDPQVPRALTLAPVLLLGAGLVWGLIGLIVASPVLLGVAAAAVGLGAALFLIVPLLVMAAVRQRDMR